MGDEMAIVLTPDQVPRYWEVIKFAAANADNVEEQYRPRYFNRLLYMLLSGKAQCFVRLSADRKLEMVGITRIEVDEIRDEKSLYALTLYSFAKVANEVWQSDAGDLKSFAKASGCKQICTWSNNPAAISLLNSVGFKRKHEVLVLDLNGGV